jgi:NDP-hexose-3-ketoreductase
MSARDRAPGAGARDRVPGAPLRIGVLGCGDIACRNTLPAMGRVDTVEVVAIASRDAAKAERCVRRFGGEPVVGYDDLIERPDVEAVYVALPNSLHYQWTRRALEAGKHVLVEKPFTVDAAEAKDLVTVARERDLWVAENFTFVHHSQHTAVRDMLDRGGLGELRAFRAAFGMPPRDPADVRYREDLGGGARLDAGGYMVRAARFFLGDDLQVLGAVLQMDTRLGVDLGGTALLCTPDGVPAEVTFSFRTSYRSMYSLWGSTGRLTLERALSTPTTWRPVVRVDRQDHMEERILAADDQFANSIRAFANSVLGGGDAERQAAALVRQAELVEEIGRRAHRVPISVERKEVTGG